jgi:hypothetical protein
MLKQWCTDVKNRLVIVRMLNISLNDGWRLVDVWFLLTGRVYGL